MLFCFKPFTIWCLNLSFLRKRRADLTGAAECLAAKKYSKRRKRTDYGDQSDCSREICTALDGQTHMTSRGQAKPKAKRLCLRLTGLGTLNSEHRGLGCTNFDSDLACLLSSSEARKSCSPEKKDARITNKLGNRQFGADCWQNVDAFGSLT